VFHFHFSSFSDGAKKIFVAFFFSHTIKLFFGKLENFFGQSMVVNLLNPLPFENNYLILKATLKIKKSVILSW